MKKVLKSSGIIIAACAVCCAPLIAVPALAALSAAGVSLAFFDINSVAAIVIAGFFGFAIWRVANNFKQKPKAAKCGCKPESGCNSSSACDV
ncbi:MAG: hypothetical protein COC23_03155 [Hyphomicrobiales bacterium]|nr:MAG: hypothetical protein COC23_03155 [Hyphomicrobiales bacterium]